MARFSDWMRSVADAGRGLLPGQNRNSRLENLCEMCRLLISSKGEAMGTAIANEVVSTYHELDKEERLGFYRFLFEEFRADSERIVSEAAAYQNNPCYESYRALARAMESPLLHLIRRVNMAPDGTATLVKLRSELMDEIKDNPELRVVDIDLKRLLLSWFNRGFLTLERINWRTPANVLEKLIAYEAVHEMQGWDDLRRRLAEDRRCFAFFHAALPEEPIIFVQVALVKGLADNVQELLAPPGEILAGDDAEEFDTAIFYSISNCQRGLQGISFGNFLIKQVVVELSQEFPQLKKFATLSPIPGLSRWLAKEQADENSPLLSNQDRQTLALMDDPDWHKDDSKCEQLKPLMLRLTAEYLCVAKRGKEPLDAVARFHLGNGARVERLNWLGDRSGNGIRQSAGMLVNYAYQLNKVEENHEAYINDNEVAVSNEIQKLLKLNLANRQEQ